MAPNKFTSKKLIDKKGNVAGYDTSSGNMTEEEANRIKKENETSKNFNTEDSNNAAFNSLNKEIIAKNRYTEMQNILVAGKHKSMTDEEKNKFVKEYKDLKLKYSFAKGGTAMKQQMEMFEDGGLKDEGGMTDEVSGNDVPSGSTREEVRDDIPAQLSEGEFVFPADVVRFLGLEKLMQLRQKAKMGLQKMESMGQMGNSEEATMPDDMPFDINDLDMEDEQEKSIDSEEEIEYNSGGVVKAAVGGAFVPTTLPTSSPYDSTKNVYTGQTNAPVASYMPTNTRNLLGGSDASQLVGGIPQTNAYGLGSQAGIDSEMFESRRYVNSDGAVRFVNFNKATGQTTTNIKQLLDQGFVRKDEAIKEVAKTATPTPNYRPRPEETNNDDGAGIDTSAKDQSFININKSTLKSEELKEALSAVSILSQLGQFSPTIGLGNALQGTNATARNMGAAIGGILDNFRGGTVEFTSKGMNTNYNDNRSLNDLTQAEQDKLGKVAAATVQQAKVTFFNYNPKTKEYDIAKQQKDVITELDKRAKQFGIKRGKNSITRYTRQIFEKIADEENARIIYNKSNLSKYKEKGDFYDFDSQRARDNRMLVQRNEKAAQRPDSIFADPIESSYDPSDYNNEDGSSTNFGSGTNVGDDETSYVGDDPFNKGGLAGKKKTPKPKKMKRGGLASR